MRERGKQVGRLVVSVSIQFEIMLSLYGSCRPSTSFPGIF